MYNIIIYCILCYYIIYINNRLIKCEEIINKNEFKMNKIGNILFNIHKKNIELTDIKLEELKDDLIDKIKSS